MATVAATNMYTAGTNMMYTCTAPTKMPNGSIAYLPAPTQLFPTSSAPHFGIQSHLAPFVGTVVPRKLVDNIQNRFLQNRHASTLEADFKAFQWFEKKFGCKIRNTPPHEILNMLNQYIDTTEDRPSTQSRHLHNVFVLSVMMNSGHAGPHVQELKNKLAVILREQESRARRSNNSCKFVPITYKDNRHILHCVIEAYGRIPFWHLFRLVLIVLGQNTGRRFGEIIFISAGDWSFKIHQKGYRIMKYCYCYEKRSGIGPHFQKFVESDIRPPPLGDPEGPVSNAIIVILSYMQVIGMIPSALDVYTGREALRIDKSRWESNGELCAKLLRAEVACKSENIKCIQSEMNDEGEDMHNTVPASLLSKLEEEDLACSKIPFFVSHSQQTERLSMQRFNFRSGRPVNRLLCEVGYTPSRAFKAGVTGTRRFFRQNHRGETVQGFDVGSHLIQHQSHSRYVGDEHYENAMHYRSNLAANIAQPTRRS
jgi:hypothetical protein